ncbi:MAG TPA: ABC transporter permease [Gemmatimonadaceae bacterium]|nr:ABC transporter permease [Gemmatimonadaceae bacterium]
MPTMSVFARALATLKLAAGFSGRASQDAELDEELAFHIEKATARHIARGMSPADARRAALIDFGGKTQWTEASRDQQRSAVLDDLARDVRYGAASLGRNPGFTVSAVITIALAIAATTTVFNFASAVYMRPLAVPEGERLVHVQADYPATRSGTIGYPAFERLRARTKAFDAIAAHYSTAPLYVTARGESGELPGAVVSADYFRMLGLRPAIGRFFLASEDSVRDRDAVVVIGHGLWHARFAGDSGVIGEHITVNGRSFTIVGVAPPGFDGITGGLVNVLWIPTMMLHTGYRFCDGFDFACAVTSTMARLGPGVELRDAQRELDGLFTTLVEGVDTARVPPRIVAAPALGIRDIEQLQYRGLSKLLWAIALVLFAVASANLSGLLLSRGMARRREFALRSSLGASRGRIVRQLLTECLMLGVIGGAVGIALTLGASRVLADFFVTNNRRIGLPVDGNVLLFVACATLLTVVMFGLFPALRMSKVSASEALKTKSSREGNRARFVLVSVQTVLAVVLLVAAGLLRRSFDRAVAGGTLDPAHLVQARLRPSLVGYSEERAARYLHDAVERVRALPGVVGATLNRWSIDVRWKGGPIFASLPGEPVPTDPASRVNYMDVGDRYFETLRVPMVAGRDFTNDDTPGAPLVTVVNESLARRLWRTTDVLGRSVVLNGSTFQVVGVVKDYHSVAVGEPPLYVAFVAFWQMPFGAQREARLGVRVAGNPNDALRAIHRALASVDPDVPVAEVATMQTMMLTSFAEVRLGRMVLLVSAALTLFLAAVGLYGVVSYLVLQRSREIAVRLAIGAAPSGVAGMVVSQGVRPILVGGVIGLAVSVSTAPLLGKWLYGIGPTDPITIGASLALVLIVAVVACTVPALRASGTDPATVLRMD